MNKDLKTVLIAMVVAGITAALKVGAEGLVNVDFSKPQETAVETVSE